MNNQTLMFSDIKMNKKDIYNAKKAIPLNLIHVNNIVVSYKVKQNNDTYKYFIGYSHDGGVIKLLCIILPQMSGYMKYFETGRKTRSFKTKDEDVIIQKKVHKFIFTTIPFIILKYISDVSSKLHSLSSFHLYNMIHKNSYTLVKVDTVTNYKKI